MNEIHFEQLQHVELTAPKECGESTMSNLLERSDRTEVTLKRSRYVGTCKHGADEELKVEIEFYVNEETLSDGVHVCVTLEGVCGVPVNECCEPTVQTTAPVCAAEAEVCMGTHLAVENVALECEAVGQYTGKVEGVECQHITLEMCTACCVWES